GVDTGIDNEMRDVDILRPQLARHRLRNRPQAELGAGKSSIPGTAAQRRSRPGKEYFPPAARHHQPRRLAAGEEAGIAGHLPDFAEHALGGVENRKIDIGADIEDADLQRRVLVRFAEKGGDSLLVARIQRARVDLAGRRFDLLDQRLELGAVATSSENRETFGGEFLGDLAANIVAGTYHRDRPVSLLQRFPPALNGQANELRISRAMIPQVCA